MPLVRVNVGCGASPTAGWVNLDGSPTVRLAMVPGLIRLLRQLRLISEEQARFGEIARAASIGWAEATRLPLADGSAEVLYSSHLLEHLEPPAARAFLAEARRVLAPGGVLRLVVPDLRRLAERYLDGGDADAFVAGTMLASERPRGLGRRLARLASAGVEHRWMYDARSLQRLVEGGGFAEVREVAPGESRIASPGPLDLREREVESSYVEATRA